MAFLRHYISSARALVDITIFIVMRGDINDTVSRPGAEIGVIDIISCITRHSTGKAKWHYSLKCALSTIGAAVARWRLFTGKWHRRTSVLPHHVLFSTDDEIIPLRFASRSALSLRFMIFLVWALYLHYEMKRAFWLYFQGSSRTAMSRSSDYNADNAGTRYSIAPVYSVFMTITMKWCMPAWCTAWHSISMQTCAKLLIYISRSKIAPASTSPL